jgi:hypothetical protein
VRPVIGVVLAILSSPVWLTVSAVPAVASDVDVVLDRARSSVAVGDQLTIAASIANPGPAPMGRSIAHLNVASLDPGVYVDLEDWTASPTQELAPLASGDSTTAAWEIQAVNVGRFAVYVVVLPTGAGSPVVSGPQLVEVAGRRTLSPVGVLPVTVIVPLLIGLGAVVMRMRGRFTRAATPL